MTTVANPWTAEPGKASLGGPITGEHGVGTNRAALDPAGPLDPGTVFRR